MDRVRTMDELKGWLGRKELESQRTIDDFSLSLKKNPAYALTWADETFKAAAMLNVVQQLLEVANRTDKSVTIENISRYVLEDVMCKATFNEHSSSQCDNMINRYKLVALGEVARYLN